MAGALATRTRRTLLAAGAAAGGMLLLALWLDAARLTLLAHLATRAAEKQMHHATHLDREAARCALDIEELEGKIAQVTENLQAQQQQDTSGLDALQLLRHECQQQTVALQDTLKEKKARLQYLKGKLNARKSEVQAMARLLAYLRDVHVTEVPERGNAENLRNALIATLLGGSEDTSALADLQALTNEQLLDQARQQGRAHLRDEI